MCVLDALADCALASAAGAPPAAAQRLVGVLHAGSARPAADGPSESPSGRFRHACLRKLFVLASRGAADQPGQSADSGAGVPETDPLRSTLAVAGDALLALAARCAALAAEHGEAEAGGGVPPLLRGSLLCSLEARRGRPTGSPRAGSVALS